MTMTEGSDEVAAPTATARPECCAWLAGCDQPPRYVAFYAHCTNPACRPGECVGALVCETHAAHERGNPDLVRMTSLAGARCP